MLERLFAKVIRLYQLTLSPWLGGQCRFYPSCSEYAHQAFVKYRWWQAGTLSLKRILKCHPFHSGGVDLLGADNEK